MNERTLGYLGTLGCILLGVIASLIAWFGGLKDSQSHEKEVVRQMFNFELSIVILGIVTSFIPVVGIVICLVLNLANLVYSIISFLAVKNNKEFKVPAFEFIK